MAFIMFPVYTLIFFIISCSLSGVLAKPPAAYVFGDSILDTGNRATKEPQTSPSRLPPYGRDFPDGVATGRYSNGQLIVDYVARYMRLKDLSIPIAVIEQEGSLDSKASSSINFAYAGSGILNTTGTGGTSLGAQVEEFKSKVVPALHQQLGNATSLHLARSVVYLATGNNDLASRSTIRALRGLMHWNKRRATFIDNSARLLLDSLSVQLQTLYDIGMRRFIVPQLMAIGCSPATGKGCFAPVNEFVVVFNKGLEDLLESLFYRETPNGRAQLHGAVIMHPKVYELSLQIASKPSDFGYKSKGPCINQILHTVCENADSYVWFDSYHPSQKFYKTMAHKLWFEDEANALPWMPKNGKQFLRETFRYNSTS